MATNPLTLPTFLTPIPAVPALRLTGTGVIGEIALATVNGVLISDAIAAGAAQVTAASSMPNTIAALTALINALPTTAGAPGTLYLNNGFLVVSQ